MYIHLGGGEVVRKKEIIGIFDLDNASWAYKTREFLAQTEQEGKIITTSDDLPRSFVVTDRAVYLSLLSSVTLARRGIE